MYSMFAMPKLTEIVGSEVQVTWKVVCSICFNSCKNSTKAGASSFVCTTTTCKLKSLTTTDRNCGNVPRSVSPSTMHLRNEGYPLGNLYRVQGHYVYLLPAFHSKTVPYCGPYRHLCVRDTVAKLKIYYRTKYIW